MLGIKVLEAVFKSQDKTAIKDWGKTKTLKEYFPGKERLYCLTLPEQKVGFVFGPDGKFKGISNWRK